MEVLDEILGQLSPTGQPFFGAVYTVWAKKGGYFQNVKTVLTFSDERVEIALSDGEKLAITGKNLCAQKYVESDLLLFGEIRGVHCFIDGEEG